ncbi:hypothetical protein BJX68DRAFT_234430 [Aspergillus pseudodeflectus]|uniref:Uncharacterized protein n=1 Tax=Aspergillus pseudodeflectus TaxID=176178 RepID=A0ABR4KMY0_9EURO
MASWVVGSLQLRFQRPSIPWAKLQLAMKFSSLAARSADARSSCSTAIVSRSPPRNSCLFLEVTCFSSQLALQRPSSRVLEALQRREKIKLDTVCDHHPRSYNLAEAVACPQCYKTSYGVPEYRPRGTTVDSVYGVR